MTKNLSIHQIIRTHRYYRYYNLGKAVLCYFLNISDSLSVSRLLFI